MERESKTQDASDVAKAAGLRYVCDTMPGITRRPKRRAFEYRDASGKLLADKDQLERIHGLAIPPAYRDVWICPLTNGHLQATGRDARGRKQYRYHARWREARDATKFERMLDFALTLPRIRERVQSDVQLPELPREKVLATVVRLLETTLIRIGNDEYAKSNGSYGLTTLKNRHAKVRGQTVRFSFQGKSGIRHALDMHDRRMARIVRQCQDLPGQQLFTYISDDGEPHPIDSSDVNAYIREIAGDDFSAKDFRTWVGTVQCLSHLLANESADAVTDRRQRITEAIKHVSQCLGNTPTVCRKSYIHPRLIDIYMTKGRFKLVRSGPHGLSPEERTVFRLLAP